MNIEFVFGGSFDPVHYGHLNIIKSLNQFFPEWPIRLLPCSVPPLKEKSNASFNQRVSMLKIAIAPLLSKSSAVQDNIIIDEREGQRAGKSYTLDSLKSLALEEPLINRVLVVGMDTLLNMLQWNQWQELSSFCHLMLIARPGTTDVGVEKIMHKLAFSCTKDSHKLEITPSGRYYYLNIKERDISSTEIRSLLKKDSSVFELIPKSVYDYMNENQIYQ